MRYYSILRPISIGTYPKLEGNEVLKINNFNTKSYCKEIDRDAWGFIDYKKPIPIDIAEEYELIPEKCCENCMWFGGRLGNGKQFCDGREMHIPVCGYCCHHRKNESK